MYAREEESIGVECGRGEEGVVVGKRLEGREVERAGGGGGGGRGGGRRRFAGGRRLLHKEVVDFGMAETTSGCGKSKQLSQRVSISRQSYLCTSYSSRPHSDLQRHRTKMRTYCHHKSCMDPSRESYPIQIKIENKKSTTNNH